jgi:hypothetical protein
MIGPCKDWLTQANLNGTIYILDPDINANTSTYSASGYEQTNDSNKTYTFKTMTSSSIIDANWTIEIKQNNN